MSMISRYQKAGGFIQLLQLIETCGKQKQDNFLSMIEKEDPRWSQAIRDKMLTIEKIFTWDDAVLGEIAGRLQQLTLATAAHGLKPEEGERLLKTFSHSQKRNIEDLKKSKSPTPAEINSAYLKILQEVRTMITQGYLRIEKFSPEMVIPEDFEDVLGKSVVSVHGDSPTVQVYGNPTVHATAHTVTVAASSPAPTPPPATPHVAGTDPEVLALRTRVQALTQENTQLKSQVRLLQDKLLQIKKIA